MINDIILEELFGLRDIKYREFQSGLLPSIEKERVIGVRTPELRKLAKTLGKSGETADFINTLPHRYFEENQLHAFIISLEKDMDICVEKVENFLPYIDNWATCDQLNPKVFKKHKDILLKRIKEWIKSDKTYTVRFAIKMLMDYFLDGDFDEKYLKMVSEVRSEEYYINMMIAWYFASALAKQYEAAVVYIEDYRLEKWTHNKTIQKSVESYRIDDEKKAYLKSLRQD